MRPARGRGLRLFHEDKTLALKIDESGEGSEGGERNPAKGLPVDGEIGQSDPSCKLPVSVPKTLDSGGIPK